MRGANFSTTVKYTKYRLYISLFALIEITTAIKMIKSRTQMFLVSTTIKRAHANYTPDIIDLHSGVHFELV